MTPKSVGVLAIAALICVVGAVGSYQANNVFIPRHGVGDKVLVGLSDSVNNVTGMVVEQGIDKLELVNKDGVWQVKDTRYPVAIGKVKKVLVGLVNLVKLEAKTGNEKKYLLIDVDGPGKPDGRGRQFTLLDKDAKQIAQIILGKIATGKIGPGRDAQYVRVSKDETSWLALGSVEADSSLASWVEPRFLKLDVDSVTYGRIEIDGEKTEVRRTGKSDSGSSLFELLDIPEGRTPRTSTTIKFAATDLVNLDLVNVRPFQAGAKETAKAFIETDTGLKLDFRLVEEYGKGWVSLKVTDKGRDTKIADAIIARTKGWEFMVADHKLAAFKKRKEMLLKKEQ